MMRSWRIRLDQYGIDRNQYDELKAFCRQYASKKAQLNALHGGFNSFAQDGMPRPKGTTGDPTGRRAAQAERLEGDIAAIDRAIEYACEPGMRHWMLLNVCYGMLLRDMPVPVSRDKFFHERRVFFWRLAVERGMVQDGASE